MADENLYQVSVFDEVREQVAEWYDAAEESGRIEWFTEAMDHIDRQLHAHPTTWGDPLFDFRKARLHVFQGNHENFVVTYAVHFDRPVVFLRIIKLLDGSPLSQA